MANYCARRSRYVASGAAPVAQRNALAVVMCNETSAPLSLHSSHALPLTSARASAIKTKVLATFLCPLRCGRNFLGSSLGLALSRMSPGDVACCCSGRAHHIPLRALPAAQENRLGCAKECDARRAARQWSWSTAPRSAVVQGDVPRGGGETVDGTVTSRAHHRIGTTTASSSVCGTG